MKILSIGYYDDFARFFLSIKSELQNKNKDLEFRYLSLYLSGYLYFLFRFNKVSFFSLSVWINKIINQAKYQKILETTYIYKNIDLNDVIKYHLLLDEKAKICLKLQALSYIDIIEKLFKNYSPDVLILSGDSRMSVEILNIKAKEFGIKTYYFEQGPFGTTIFDNKGVNANASIRQMNLTNNTLSFDESDEKIKRFFARKKVNKYKRSPIYRGSDYIFQYLFLKLGLVPIDIKMEDFKTSTSGEYKLLQSVDANTKNKKVLLILQVPYDVNMVYHSPFYNNHYSIVKDLHQNLPRDSFLVIREHPLYKGKYESELYTYMLENNITLDINELYCSIDSSSVVVVNNSTVGIEAISRYKNVVVLGNSYYDNDAVCIKLKEKENLKPLLERAISSEVDKNRLVDFLYLFFADYLIDGHYQDEYLKCTHKIVQRILDDI
jgi:capsular polysaccharide export protein